MSAAAPPGQIAGGVDDTPALGVLGVAPGGFFGLSTQASRSQGASTTIVGGDRAAPVLADLRGDAAVMHSAYQAAHYSNVIRDLPTVLESADAALDQLGHARVSMTQDVYFGRRILGEDAARALDDAHAQAREDNPDDDKGEAPVGVPAG